MRSCKMLGAAMLATALMMLGAGGASATTLTSPAGTQYGGTLKFQLKENTFVTWKSSFLGEAKCEQSVIESKVESQGAEVTAAGHVTNMEFRRCNGEGSIPRSGTLEIHTENSTANGNGTLTSTGTEITIELLGLHCIFSTNNTDLGKVTGGTTATFTAASASIPRTGGRSGAFCGSSASWSAEYTVVTPDTLLVD